MGQSVCTWKAALGNWSVCGLGVVSVLLSYPFVVEAGNPDPKLERLERLERALQIDDCAYAVEELEHLNLSYSDMSLRYALLAEGYLCIGKPAKAKLAVAEFARLGGEPNQLSLRVQEYCALQDCAVEPVLVKPVEHHGVEDDAMSESQRTIPDTVLEPKIVPVEEALVVEEPLNTPVQEVPIDDVRIVPVVEPEETIEVQPIEPTQQESLPESNVTKIPSTDLPYSVSDINAMIIDGQCVQATAIAQQLITIEPENPQGHMALGDALACYPEGSGDIFAAFDAWMQAKSLAKQQGVDWQPIKDRLGWALQRSGIVKVIPVFSEGYTEWPEGFSISLESSTPVDLTPRTDHMLGGTYLTNLPEGKTTIRITPGGARPDIVQTLNIVAGELQKIRVPIGQEQHVRLPALLSLEEYQVVLTSDQENGPVLYTPSTARLLPIDDYTVAVEYKEQTYDFQLDVKALVEEANQQGVPFESVFRPLLPWVYQVRNPEGALLGEGLVYPDQTTQDIALPLETVSYETWRDGGEPQSSSDSITLMASGNLSNHPDALFSEVVIDPQLHPFFSTAEDLYALEMDLTNTNLSRQWLTGMMLTSAAWTGVSLGMANQSDPDSEFWERQALVGSVMTMPMVGLWMMEKVIHEPRQQRAVQRTRTELLAMDREPVSFTSLYPEPVVLDTDEDEFEDAEVEERN